MKLFVSTMLTLLLMSALTAQAQPIEGKVVDAEGQPLPGVSVVTDVAGVGVITDTEGAFRLEKSEGVTRVTFSSVGYQPRQFKREGIPTEVVLESRYYRGEDIVVAAARAETGMSPVAFDNLSRLEIERDYTISDFPILLESTPNFYAYSYSGSGSGASEFKIRGFDSKRISVYINGVPLNDPEDHATYFVDLPDFAEETTDIQVQRGVGNSLFGDASFGGSINIASGALDRDRRVAVTAGYGQFFADGDYISDMRKQSVEYSSGLIDGRWSLAGRYSKLYSGGYREQSWYDGWSYFLSVSRLDPNMITTVNLYGGPIKYHMAWDGIDRETQKTARRTNWLDYSNETDNFDQPHYEFHNTYRLSDNVTLRNTLYYIRGKGFYEQFKSGRDIDEYNIPASAVSDGSTEVDLVRQQWVTKNQYGIHPRVDVAHERGEASFGGSFYYFDSEHWGQVVWAERVTSEIDPRLRYYEWFGKKIHASLYMDEKYDLTEKVRLTGDIQLKYLRQEFDQTEMGAFAGYEFDLDWFFLSPRVGVTFAPIEPLSLYTSFAISSREPNDNTIYDANDPWVLPNLEVVSDVAGSPIEFGDPIVSAERLYDIEVGGNYTGPDYKLSLNLYWMEFTNEIIAEGGIDDAGQPILGNADRSVHRGIEFNGSWRPDPRLGISGNWAYNYDRLKDYILYKDTDWNGVTDDTLDLSGNHVSGFPEYLGNLILDGNVDPLRMVLRLRAVGRQYVENENNKDLSIDPYWVASLSTSVALGEFAGLGRLTLSGRIDNLFDKKYELTGYTWDGVGYYIPAAERNFFVQMKWELE